MVKKGFYLALDDMTARAIQTIALAIPCFITLEEQSDGFGLYIIEARQDDWCFVEKILAPIV